jgi:hypothetical protein
MRASKHLTRGPQICSCLWKYIFSCTTFFELVQIVPPFCIKTFQLCHPGGKRSDCSAGFPGLQLLLSTLRKARSQPGISAARLWSYPLLNTNLNAVTLSASISLKLRQQELNYIPSLESSTANSSTSEPPGYPPTKLTATTLTLLLLSNPDFPL